MNDTDHRASTAHQGGESVVLGALAVVAYVAFAAFAMLHDGGRPGGGEALAGVPVDAVRAAAAARDPVGVDAIEDPVENAGPAENVGVAVGRPIPEDGAEPDVTVGVATSRSLGAADIQELRDPAVAAGNVLQFLVKFEEDEAMAWRDRYIANPADAREAFEAFAARNSAFSNMRLTRMNASGVATLEFDGPAPASQDAARQLSSELAGRMNNAAGVEYAEPNLVGWRENSQQ